MKMKLIFTEDQRSRLNIIDGPVWTDGCEHGADTYVCSFQCIKHGWNHPPEKYDLYVFPHKYYGQEVCIRFGNSGEQYASPGGLTEFLGWRRCRPLSEEYAAADQILSSMGMATWQPRPPSP